MNQPTLEQQLDEQLNPPVEANDKNEPESINKEKKSGKPCGHENNKVLGVGDWMITILLYLIPILNIIMMAVWAFSSSGNINRRNLSRACLLWIIILLIAYVVAMTIAGYTILDIFRTQG